MVFIFLMRLFGMEQSVNTVRNLLYSLGAFNQGLGSGYGSGDCKRIDASPTSVGLWIVRLNLGDSSIPIAGFVAFASGHIVVQHVKLVAN